MLKLLSSLSHSNALIVMLIIKTNFNNTYCTVSIGTGISGFGTANMCAGDVKSK